MSRKQRIRRAPGYLRYDVAEFIRVWQDSSTVQEVRQRLKISTDNATRARALNLIKNGIPLAGIVSRNNMVDWNAMKALALEGLKARAEKEK